MLCNEGHCGPSGGEKFQWLMKFLASKVKCPWKRLETVIVLVGPHGVGKTYLSHLMGAILGDQHYLYRVGGSPLKEEFGVGGKEISNLWMTIDEFSRMGVEEQSKLKGRVTADTRVVNEKNVTKFEVPNHTTLMLITNQPDALQEEPTARRFMFFRTLLELCGPATAESTLYFNRLFGVRYDLVGQYLYWYVDTDGFDPRIMPRTAERQQHLERMVCLKNKVMEWAIFRLHCVFDGIFDGKRKDKDVVLQDFLSWKRAKHQEPGYEPVMSDSPLTFLHSGHKNSSQQSVKSSESSFWKALIQLFGKPGKDPLDEKRREQKGEEAQGGNNSSQRQRRKTVVIPTVEQARQLLDERHFAYHPARDVLRKDWQWGECTMERHTCGRQGHRRQVEPESVNLAEASTPPRPPGRRAANASHCNPESGSSAGSSTGKRPRNNLTPAHSPLKNESSSKKASHVACLNFGTEAVDANYDSDGSSSLGSLVF